MPVESGKRIKDSSILACLSPVIKEGRVLRVGGRISRAPISPDAMNPMILPRNHYVTGILARCIHETNGLCGHKQVLSILRQQFWVPQAHVVIRQVLNKCINY